MRGLPTPNHKGNVHRSHSKHGLADARTAKGGGQESERVESRGLPRHWDSEPAHPPGQQWQGPSEHHRKNFRVTPGSTLGSFGGG